MQDSVRLLRLVFGIADGKSVGLMVGKWSKLHPHEVEMNESTWN
jgi:hypothetical protein